MIGPIEGRIDSAHTTPEGREGAATAAAARFLFTCTSSLENVGPFTTLPEMWSSPAYMKIDSATASYVGAGDFVLTDEESAIVAVAEDAGMAAQDRNALYLTILGACTRISSQALDGRLAEFGDPVVLAALTLAPNAPQADLLRSWLESREQ